MRNTYYSLIITLLVYTLNLSGQLSNIDSLKTNLNNADTTKVNRLIALSAQFEKKGEYSKSIEMANQALFIAQKINCAACIGRAYIKLSNIYRHQGNYPKSLELCYKLLNVCEETKNISLKASALMATGNVYSEQKNYHKALDFYFKALSIVENLQDKSEKSSILTNIGIIYWSLGENSKALEYYFNALKINDELGAGQLLGLIANVYSSEQNYVKAMEYDLKALRNAEENNDKYLTACWQGNIGSDYVSLGKLNEGEKYLKMAINNLESIGSLNELLTFENELSKLYERKGQHKKALYYYKNVAMLKDSLYNMEKNNEITRLEINAEFSKKEAVQAAEHKKEIENQKAIAEEKNRKQKLISFSVCLVLLLVITFSIFAIRSLKITRRQKLIIEEKQKNILDSIHYAERIQRSLLPTEIYIEKMLSHHNLADNGQNGNKSTGHNSK